MTLRIVWACGRCVQAYDDTPMMVTVATAMASFSELYCRRHGIERARYADTMFWRCLHRRAQVFAFLIRPLAPDFFQADYELIHSVGEITSTKSLPDELANFSLHPSNRGWLRRRLKLRISGRRLYRVVAEILPGKGEHSGTIPPIPH